MKLPKNLNHANIIALFDQEGLMVVPVEPTLPMLRAAEEQGLTPKKAQEIYSEMLLAYEES